jgi:hypothetical protein
MTTFVGTPTHTPGFFYDFSDRQTMGGRIIEVTPSQRSDYYSAIAEVRGTYPPPLRVTFLVDLFPHIAHYCLGLL